MTFRALMAITAKFDLETVQLNAINAFVNYELDEVVYMKQPPNFKIGRNIILQLRKALYGLRKSPLLWQKELISTFKNLEFKKIPQKSYVMINKDVIIFFYVNDIVIYYRKKDEKMAKTAIIGLKTRYAMNELESLK